MKIEALDYIKKKMSDITFTLQCFYNLWLFVQLIAEPRSRLQPLLHLTHLILDENKYIIYIKCITKEGLLTFYCDITFLHLVQITPYSSYKRVSAMNKHYIIISMSVINLIKIKLVLITISIPFEINLISWKC